MSHYNKDSCDNRRLSGSAVKPLVTGCQVDSDLVDFGSQRSPGWPQPCPVSWGEVSALCLAGANLGSMSQPRAAMLLIVTDDGRLLLHHRDDKPGIAHPGCWAGFGGAVEEGETVEEALRREVLEETGLVIEDPRLLTEAVDVEGGGRLVSLFYIRGSFSPEQIELHEGAGVGVHSLDELDDLDVTPFVRRAISSHLAPLIGG